MYYLLGQTKYHNEGKAVQERSSREFRQSLSSSDQVRGQETSPVPEGILVGYNGMEWSPAHNLTNESDLSLASKLINILEEF